MQKLNFLISIILAFGLCFLGCQNSINPSESSESEQSGMEILTCLPPNGGNGDGCTLTPGYWKTHSDYGPAPYDETWAEIGGEIPPCEENTPFFNSGKSYYQVLWTPPKKGNAYYILAHAYIAAELNRLNLSEADFTDAEEAFDQATGLFEVEANTPGVIVKLKGKDREVWIDLAEILDNYNNGIIGPGHCP
ncbi:MAG: hypothetical protein KAV45_10425 [Calditrichia bacterium]|nr:hypothetical protein [Calditrichia bacterium]